MDQIQAVAIPTAILNCTSKLFKKILNFNVMSRVAKSDFALITRLLAIHYQIEA